MNAQLSGVRACVFDAYGTLFDVASAALRQRDVLGDKAPALAAQWRDKQLQYTWLRAAQGRHADFQQVTREALAFCMQQLGIDAALEDRLMRSYDALAAYPEVPDVLRRIRQAGLATAILSNGTPAMLAALVAGAQLDGLFDHVISVESVGHFKPHPAVYRQAVQVLGLPAQQICFQSSNGWDAYAASAFGMRVVWCNRLGQPAERLPGAPDAQVATLAQLPALLGIAA